MLSTPSAGVILGVERAAGTRFALGRVAICGGDEFLARSALCDCHQDNTTAQCRGKRSRVSASASASTCVSIYECEGEGEWEFEWEWECKWEWE